MKTESNKNRGVISSRGQFRTKQEKFNKEFAIRLKHLYALMGQAKRSVLLINERLIQLAGYSRTSRKMLESLGKQSHQEIARMKAELDDINRELDDVQKRLEALSGGAGPLPLKMQPYLVYAAILFSMLSMGLSLWLMMGG